MQIRRIRCWGAVRLGLMAVLGGAVLGGCGGAGTPMGGVTTTLTLTPANAGLLATAKWTLDSDPTQHASGEQVARVTLGTHTVKFGAVAGYNTPANQTVTVAANAYALVNANYTLTTGNAHVVVTLNPANAGLLATAKWTLDADATQHASGDAASVAPGSHTVKFAAVAGYLAPADQTVTVTANNTTEVTATYLATPSLTVTLAPAAAVTAGAKWTLDNDSTLHASGDTVVTSAGSHTVKFGAATGYTAPANQTVTVAAGPATAVTGTYTQAVRLHLVNGTGGWVELWGTPTASAVTCQAQLVLGPGAMIGAVMSVPGVTQTSLNGPAGTFFGERTTLDVFGAVPGTDQMLAKIYFQVGGTVQLVPSGTTFEDSHAAAITTAVDTAVVTVVS